jgi:hypothetical protein
MNKAVALVLLARGILLLILGGSAWQSFSSDVSRLFTGAPTENLVYGRLGVVVRHIMRLNSALNPDCLQAGSRFA